MVYYDMKTKILVTGAGGYIGSVAAYLYLQKGLEVVAVDSFETGFRGPLDTLTEKFGSDQLRIYEANISEIETVLEKEKDIQAVVHYAASCSVDESMKKPEKYFTNDTANANALLVALMKHGIKNVIFSSTCAVYGDAQYVPIDESHPTNPANPYGASKRMLEQMMEWYGKLGKLNYVILRYFNVCGASDDGFIGDAKKPSVHLMQNAVRGALGLEPFFLTCGKFDTPDGTPIRDYVNVVDLNEAHYAAIQYLLDGGKSEIINLGTGNGNSVLEIVQKVQDLTGAKFNLQTTTAREGEYATMIAQIDKARSVLKWNPTHTLEDSVKSLVTWYKAHPNGWER